MAWLHFKEEDRTGLERESCVAAGRGLISCRDFTHRRVTQGDGMREPPDWTGQRQVHLSSKGPQESRLRKQCSRAQRQLRGLSSGGRKETLGVLQLVSEGPCNDLNGWTLGQGRAARHLCPQANCVFSDHRSAVGLWSNC